MNERQISGVSRRRFIGGSASAIAAGALAGQLGAAAQAAGGATVRPGMKKAVKIGMVRVEGSIREKFQLLKDLGFDGVEMDSPTQLNLDEVLAARDATGLEIPGVVDSVHWRDTLSHPDAQVRERGLEGLKTALRDCKRLGGTTVLLVPAVVNKEVSYDQAYERSQAEIRKVLPLCEELGIGIAIENVWNQFLLSPLEAARYTDELNSPLVGWHFDVGNVVNYGWPEQWVRILGKRIVKLDIKEFSRQRRNAEGLSKGFDVELLEGDCDWPAVMKALDEIGYRGWGCAEIPGGGRERLQEIARRMDRIYAA